MISLYNSLSRGKEPLPEQKKIRLFVCGPTVYDYLHIGNARTYIFFDFFAKYLRSRGYDVMYLQNITDIDDKIIRRAGEEQKDPAAFAKHFTERYFEDMATLGVTAVTTYAPATNFISQIVAQVERLIDGGYAYKIDGDGWYFDIAKDKDYGKLSGRTTEQAEDGVSRIDESVNKRNKGDFCLWKFSAPGEPTWPSALGDGRPGWHIEDTAISEFYFGPQYEIHGGGVDLKFPHHEAEIAQQESASGLTPFVRTWMHVGALLVGGKKMSKSVGNFITIRDFLSKHPPAILRWIVIGHPYRTPLDYVEPTTVEQAQKELGTVYETVYALSKELHAKGHHAKPDEDGMRPWSDRWDDAMDDDLNIAKAMAVFHEAVGSPDLDPATKLALLDHWDAFLGIGIAEARYRPEEEAAIAGKVAEYRELRGNKQFIQSDALRKEIEGLGYTVRDTAEGPTVVKKFF